MKEAQRCSNCGAAVPRQSPGGLCPRCCLWGLEEVSEEDFQLGEERPELQIPGFEIIRLVGTGAFGEVFECLEFEPAVRRVAIKLLKSEMMGAAERLKEEIQILATLDHPAIARLYAAGQLKDGRPYYAMEFVGGQNFSKWLEKEQPSLDQRVEVLQQIAEGLAHAHEQGIVHRDLKPGNLIVTRRDGRWRAKIIDFGVARAIHGIASFGRELTLAETFLGTPQYMSPEQLAGSKQIGPDSDTYSLGLLTLEALFQEPVVPREHEDRELTWLEFYEWRKNWRLQRWPGRVHDSVRGAEKARQAFWIGRKASSWEREDRYAGGASLAKEFARWLENRKIEASAERPWARLLTLIRYHRAAAVMLVAGLLVVAGFGLGGPQFFRVSDFVSGGMQTNPQRSDNLVEEARLAMEAGDLGDARRRLQQAVMYWPENRDALFALRAMDSLCPEATALTAIDLPGRGVDVWGVKDGRWAVELGGGGGILVDERGRIEPLTVLPEKGGKRWRGRSSIPWQASARVPGEVSFKARSGTFPPMQKINYTMGDGGVALHNGGLRMAAVDGSKRLLRWDLREIGRNREMVRLEGANHAVFERGTGTLWIISEGGKLCRWQPGYGVEPGIELPGLARIADAAVNQHPGDRGVRQGLAAIKYLIAVAQWQAKHQGSSVAAVARASDTDRALLALDDGALALWNEDETLVELADQSTGVRLMAISADGDLAAIVSGKRQLIVFEIESGRVVFDQTIENAVSSLCFDRAGETLAIGRADGLLELVRVDEERWKSRRVDLLKGRIGSGKVTVVPTRQDSSFLVSIDGDRWIHKLGSQGEPRPRISLEHDQAVDRFFASHDGSLIISTEHNPKGEGRVRIWSARSGLELMPPATHSASIKWVGLSPDSRHLATICSDGSLHRWAFFAED